MWQALRRFKKDECSRTRAMLSDYMDRRLKPEQLAGVEEHLQTCRGCREELDSLRATVVLLHRLPEATPSRSFAVAPVRPLPGRRALPALRFATAGAVLLLVVAFAVDQTNVLEKKRDDGLGMSFAADSHRKGAALESDSYWTVDGVKNSVDPATETVENTTATLVVPDGSDNVYAAVTFLSRANDGVLYGNTAYSSDEVPQLALSEGEEEAAAVGEVEEFTVIPAPVVEKSRFATNDAAAVSAWGAAIVGQDGSYLNLLNSDNTELYSFDLEAARKEFKAAPDRDWLRPVEYGLIGLVVVLGGATLALWFRQRRQKAAEVS